MKKVLAILLALTMALSLCSTAWANDDAVVTEGEANAPVVQEGTTPTYVAQIGETKYETLAAAVAAVKSGETITLLTNCHGNGITVPSGSEFTIDFNTYTYTVDGSLVGSTGTESQAFQLLRDSTLTFKNGTITSTKAKMLIQNYSNLTLDNMKIDGSKILGSYTLSNNNGNVTIKDTAITAPNGGFAFDVYGGWATYGDVKVTVEGNSVINGKVELARANQNDNGAKNELVVNNGTFNYEIKVDSHEKTSVSVSAGTFVNDVTSYVTDKTNPVAAVGTTYAVGDTAISAAAAKATSNDTVTVKQGSVSLTGVASGVTVAVADGASATVNNTAVPAGKSYTVGTVNAAKVGDVEYATLADAVAAANAGDTITLLSDCDVSTPISVGKKLTINLNGKTITGKNGDAGCRVFNVVAGGDLTLTGKGTVTTVAKNDSAFVDASSVIRVGDDTTGAASALTIDANVTIAAPASYGITIFGTNAEQTLTVNGTVTSAKASAISGNGSSKYNETKITINAGAVVKSTVDAGIYHPQKGTLTINGGTIEGPTAVEMKAGTVTVNGGTLTATGKVDHDKNSNGVSTSGYALALVENNSYKGAANADLKAGTFNGKVGVVKDDDNIADDKKAAASITGGIFDSDVSGLVASTASVAELNGKYYVGETAIKEAAKIAKFGDTITVIQGDVTLTGVVRGVTVKNNGTGTVKVNGTTVKAGKSYKVSRTTSSTTGTKTDTKKDDGKKDIKSATTFDAGIALYVGMSILSLTGTAAVIGKKKEL